MSSAEMRIGGKTASVESKRKQELIAEIYKRDPERKIKDDLITKIRAKQKEQSGPQDATGKEKLMSLIQGTGSGVSFGYTPELQALAEPVTDAIFNLLPQDKYTEAAGGVETEPDFDKRLESANINFREDVRKAPGHAIVGEVIGALSGPGAALKGAKYLGRGAKALAGTSVASKLAKATGVAGASEKIAKTVKPAAAAYQKLTASGPRIAKAAGWGRALGVGGAEAGAYGFAMGDPYGEGELTAKERFTRAAYMVPFGMGLATVAKAGIPFLTGVSEETAALYEARMVEIDGLLKRGGYKAVRDDMAMGAERLIAEFESGAKTAKEIGEEFARDKQAINQVLKESKVDIKQAARDMKMVEQTIVKGLKDEFPAPTVLTEDIITAQKELRDKLVDHSDAAIAKLIKTEGGDIPQDIGREVAEAALNKMDDLLTAPVVIRAKQGTRLQPRVPRAGQDKTMKEIYKLGREYYEQKRFLKYGDIKQEIKNLNAKIKYGDETGIDQNTVNQFRQELAAILNKKLKENEVYAKEMLKVQELAKLKESADKFLGTDPKKLNSILNSIESEGRRIEKETIFRLMGETEAGARIEPQLREYLHVKAIIEDYKNKNGLPEEMVPGSYLEAKELAKKSEDIRSMEAQSADEIARLEMIKNEKLEKIALDQASRRDMVSYAKKIKDNPEGEVNGALMTFKKPEAYQTTIKERLKGLSEAVDNADFEQRVRDLSVSMEFDPAMRNIFEQEMNLRQALFHSTRMGAWMVGGTGLGVTSVFAPHWALIAGGISMFSRKYGPEITKMMLKKMSSIPHDITIKEVMQLPIDDIIKHDILRDLRRAYGVVGVKKYAPVNLEGVDDTTVNAIVDKIRDSSWITNSDQGEMINGINKNKELKKPQVLLTGSEDALPDGYTDDDEEEFQDKINSLRERVNELYPDEGEYEY